MLIFALTSAGNSILVEKDKENGLIAAAKDRSFQRNIIFHALFAFCSIYTLYRNLHIKLSVLPITSDFHIKRVIIVFQYRISVKYTGIPLPLLGNIDDCNALMDIGIFGICIKIYFRVCVVADSFFT